MIYEDFVRTLLARMGLPYSKVDAGAVRDGVDRLVRLSAMVDDLLAEAGYDAMFDTREKCLEALRQDIKANLSTAPVDRETLARAIWDASVKADRRPEWHLLAADVALRLIRPAPAAKVVDQEGLAKLLYNPHGGAAVAWEHKSEAARSHFRDMAAAALKYIGATSTANETRARNLLSDEVLRLRTELADAQRQVGVWRDSVETQKKMRLDLAVEQDKLVAALDEAQNQLAAERKKWPELKAELATACAERAKEVVHNRELNAQVERTRALVRARGLTIALLEKIILGHADPDAVLRDAETGETAHIAPDVRVALKRQQADIEQMARTNFDLRKELGDLRASDTEVRFTIANKLLGMHRTSAPAWDELLVKLEECLKELTDMALARVPEYVALIAAKKPLDRDRVRLALLDFSMAHGVQFVQQTVNDLADHLVKRLS